MALSRRSFLGLTGAAAAGGALGWSRLGDDAAEPQVVPTTTTVPVDDTERQLVVVQLAGGNDALNTLVPASLGTYRDARPSLGVAEGDLLALDDEHALHPALAPLVGHWERGELAALASIGFEDASRSHFVAMDWWWNGAPGSARTGWLGRWLDATSTGDPEQEVLRAVAIGGPSAANLRAETALSTSLRDPASFALQLPGGRDVTELAEAWGAAAAPGAEGERAAVDTAIRSTLHSVDAVGEVLGADPDRGADADPAAGPAAPMTAALGAAADLLTADLGTRIVVVGAGGFDTHSDQAPRHAELLGDLATGIDTLFERLGDAAERVLLVTTSEFGRRVRENGSGGTDHGQGGTQFVVGPAVDGGRVVGEYDLDRLVDGDLRPTIDVASLYAVALDWLGGPTDEILGASPDRLGLVG